MKQINAEYVAEVTRLIPLRLDPDDAKTLLEVLAEIQPLLGAVDELPAAPADDPFAFPSILREGR